MLYGSVAYQDVISAFTYLNTTLGYPQHRIGVYGISMGGATVTIAGGMDPRMKTIFVDSPVCDTQSVLATNVGGTFGGIFGPVKGLISSMAFDQAQGWFSAYMAKDRKMPNAVYKDWWPLAKSKLYRSDQNVYVVNNVGDEFVPIEQGKGCIANAKAGGANVMTKTFDDIKDFKTNVMPQKCKDDGDKCLYYTDTHGMMMMYYPKEYNDILVKYMTQYLGHTGAASTQCVKKHSRAADGTMQQEGTASLSNPLGLPPM